MPTSAFVLPAWLPVLPTWAAKLHLGANLSCQGALGLHSACQLGVQEPSQSAPSPAEPRSRVHENAKSANRLLCSPNALGLLFGSSWGLLGRLLDSTWSLLASTWPQLGLNLGSLGLCWGSSWGLLDASWAPLGPLGRLLGQLGALWAPSGLQMDAKWVPIGLPKRLPVSTHALRTPKQPPSPTARFANSTFVAGGRHMQH